MPLTPTTDVARRSTTTSGTNNPGVHREALSRQPSFTAPARSDGATSVDRVVALDDRNGRGQTRLMRAVSTGNKEEVTRLLELARDPRSKFDVFHVDERHSLNVLEHAPDDEMRHHLETQIARYCEAVGRDPANTLKELGSPNPACLRSPELRPGTVRVAAEPVPEAVHEATEDLHAAAFHGNLEEMTAALENGARFDQPNRFTGNTLIHALAFSPRLDPDAATLAIHGSDLRGAQVSLTARDQRGLTALQSVAHANRPELVNLILSAVAPGGRDFDLFAKDPKGRTFMQLAPADSRQLIAASVVDYCRIRRLDPDATLRRLDPDWAIQNRA